MKTPTIIEDSGAREGARAKWWRVNVAKLTVLELADLTGYTAVAIYLMERGINSEGARVKPWAWRRYLMACAGVHHQLTSGRVFAWDEIPNDWRAGD